MKLVLIGAIALSGIVVSAVSLEAKKSHGKQYYEILSKFYKHQYRSRDYYRTMARFYKGTYAQTDTEWLYAPINVYWGSRLVGRDPDPQVRLNLYRDWAPRNR